jgi:hypothetical protein
VEHSSTEIGIDQLGAAQAATREPRTAEIDPGQLAPEKVDFPQIRDWFTRCTPVIPFLDAVCASLEKALRFVKIHGR